MADDIRVYIELFPAGFWRWHFCIVWNDGVLMRSTKPSFGYGRTRDRAITDWQEARRG